MTYSRTVALLASMMAAVLATNVVIRAGSTQSGEPRPEPESTQATHGLPAAEGPEDGEEKAVVERVCTSCHVMELPPSDRRTKESWTAIMDEMVNRGAELTESEYATVVRYLVRHFGPVKINVASLAELKAVGFSEAEAKAIVEIRTQRGPFSAVTDLSAVPGLTAERLQILSLPVVFESKPSSDH